MFHYENQLDKVFKEREKKEWIGECARGATEMDLSEYFGKKVVINRKWNF